jgi:carbonic anhydrase
MTPDAVMVIAVLAAATAVIVGGALALARRGAGLRTETVRQVADRLGWPFRDEVPYATIPDLDRFELFRPGRSKKIRNVMTSPAGAPRSVIFDYSYVTGGGNSQRTHKQTVCYVVDDALDLPSFSLRPENFFHRVAGVFGYQDIDFDDRPEFSRLFLLRGENEPSVRAAFSEGVTEFFAKRPGTCAAGMRSELLFWRTRGYAGKGEIERLVADGVELARRFAPVAGRRES